MSFMICTSTKYYWGGKRQYEMVRMCRMHGSYNILGRKPKDKSPLYKTYMQLGKAIPIQVWVGPQGSRRLRLAKFLDNQHMQVARLSAVCNGQHIPLEPISVGCCVKCAAGRIILKWILEKQAAILWTHFNSLQKRTSCQFLRTQ
jgi:hypothetical protein